MNSPGLLRRKFQAKFRVLTHVKEGWDTGYGSGRIYTPSKKGHRWLRKAFTKHWWAGNPEVWMCVNVGGWVSANWWFPSYGEKAIVVFMEIDCGKHTGDVWAHDCRSETTLDDRKLNLDSADDWAWLVERVRRYSRLELPADTMAADGVARGAVESDA